MNPIEFKQAGWIYRVHLKESFDYDFEVIDPNNTAKPRYLYKHFALTEYSIDSLAKNYLYASHPLQLNDPYDCNRFIFDLQSTPLSVFQNFFGNPEIRDQNLPIQDLYLNHRQKLIDLFLDGFWHIMYSKCGIVSMSDLPTNIQMWAYYSKLDGFQIKLDTQKIPTNFKGPLKVRYSAVISKIPIERDFFLPVLYQITNKENNWDHESEWRYLVIGPDEMEVPYSLFENVQKSPHNRKFPYDISALKEITLGCYFFQQDDYDEIGKNHMLIDLSNSSSQNTILKIKLLNYIAQHPDIDSKFIYWEKYSKYNLVKVQIKVLKKQDYKFELIILK